MKVALLSATGFVGSALLKEALGRGHLVKGLCTHLNQTRPRCSTLDRLPDRSLSDSRRTEGQRAQGETLSVTRQSAS